MILSDSLDKVTLKVRDVVDFVYCSRIPYFKYCVKAGKEVTPKMLAGREIHKNMLKSLKKRFRGDVRYNLYLHSHELGLSTTLDFLIIEGEKAIPVELKFSESEIIFKTYKYQLAAQSLLLESLLDLNVDYGLIFFHDGREARISIIDYMKRKVIEIIRDVREIIIKEKIPKPTRFKKRCMDCYYSRLCRRV